MSSSSVTMEPKRQKMLTRVSRFPARYTGTKAPMPTASQAHVPIPCIEAETETFKLRDKFRDHPGQFSSSICGEDETNRHGTMPPMACHIHQPKKTFRTTSGLAAPGGGTAPARRDPLILACPVVSYVPWDPSLHDRPLTTDRHQFPTCHLAHRTQCNLGSNSGRLQCWSHRAAMELVECFPHVQLDDGKLSAGPAHLAFIRNLFRGQDHSCKLAARGRCEADQR